MSSYLQPEDQLLDFPLTPGKAFGAEEIRRDRCYCWVIAGRVPFRAGPITSLHLRGASRRFILTSYEGTGDQRLEFVPGLGITAYKYRHHGTIDTWNLHLVRFGKM